MIPLFEPFKKIPRLLKETVYITEKIDGTNACVNIFDDDSGRNVIAGSRARWLNPEINDNFGFAKWVAEHADELKNLGPGLHYGEWWGQGIQRGYGLSEKRFSLFNCHKWSDRHSGLLGLSGRKEEAPECCHVVPYLGVYQLLSLFENSGLAGNSPSPSVWDEIINTLQFLGSSAAPGFKDPEGVVLFLAESKQSYKWTFKNPEGKHTCPLKE